MYFGTLSYGRMVYFKIGVNQINCFSTFIVLQTTITRVKLKGYPVIQPGSKCNYMLAAINVHGSEGFTFPRTYTKGES